MVFSGLTAGSTAGTSYINSLRAGRRGLKSCANGTQSSFPTDLAIPPRPARQRRRRWWKLPRRPFWIKYPSLPNSPGIFNNPATTVRRRLIYISTFFSLLSLVFTILVLIGNMYDQPVLNRIYFLKLDLSNLIPTQVPNSVLINSIAQSLGLRDFYQVGLWGYCEGYNDKGVTWCTKPKNWYWFDPVEIITKQLLKGAKIALPEDIAKPLELAKGASYWMFVTWLVGAVFTLLSVCGSWVAIYSRWTTGCTGAVVGVAMGCITIGATMATTIYSLFRSTFEKAPGVTVSGILGKEMFMYMWMAAGFNMAAFVLQCGMCCCVRTEKQDRKRRAGGGGGKKDGDETGWE
ncbi:SUR7/PalI family-domain-containing protein [Tirmania nivea]|nr:SUR7/PalI family-domain-containing protein [Tirmania nivea]